MPLLQSLTTPFFSPPFVFLHATNTKQKKPSFFLHRWMHQNKTAFRLMHAKHHEQRAALDVTTSGYMSFNEGCFSSALPMLLLYLLGMRTGNWWYTLAGVCARAHG